MLGRRPSLPEPWTQPRTRAGWAAEAAGLAPGPPLAGPPPPWGAPRPTLTDPTPRPSTTGRSASGRLHSASLWSSTPAPPTCGSRPSTASCWTSPAVSPSVPGPTVSPSAPGRGVLPRPSARSPLGRWRPASPVLGRRPGPPAAPTPATPNRRLGPWGSRAGPPARGIARQAVAGSGAQQSWSRAGRVEAAVGAGQAG